MSGRITNELTNSKGASRWTEMENCVKPALSLAFFLASALIAAPTLAAEHDHIASPVAHMLLHDSLVTNVRTSVQHIKHGAYPNFQGTVKGIYIQTAGKGSYIGTFKGNSTTYKTSGNFKMDGSINYMELYATGTSGVKGKCHLAGKGPSTKLSMSAYYSSKMRMQRYIEDEVISNRNFRQGKRCFQRLLRTQIDRRKLLRLYQRQFR